MNEMFEIVELTFASTLGWFTGQKHRQLNGEKIQITVKFDHDVLFATQHTPFASLK